MFVVHVVLKDIAFGWLKLNSVYKDLDQVFDGDMS